ncbi:MAG: thioredoxin [bacterium]
MIRHISFLLLLLFLSFSSCGNAHGDQTTASDTTMAKPNSDGLVIKLTAAEFKKLIWDYEKSPSVWKYKGDIPCLVDFYADWCRPCKMVAPIMDELAKTYKGKVRIYKVNTDEQRELSGIFQIRSIPTMLFIPKKGEPQMSAGAMPKESYVEIINKMLSGK